MLRLNLDASPLRNYFKYDGDNIYDLLLPFMTSLVSEQHYSAGSPLPPVAFVLKGNELLYLNGYSKEFGDPDKFLADLSDKAETADAVITMSEFGSLDDDFSRCLVLCVVQTPSYYRCKVFGLADGSSYDVFEDPFRIELPSTSDVTDNTCYLMGVESLFHSFFV